ncbi:MAG: GtrA family protein [Chloroflexi bacterium]|nr:GtrA family protein [Chloroflexota bacterium]
MLSSWRLVRYLAAGGGSFTLDVALQAAFVNLTTLPVSLAATASYEIALVAHFFVNNQWVFKQPGSIWRRLIEFHMATAIAYGITIGVMWLLSDGPVGPHLAAGLGPYATGGYVAKAIGTAAAFFWTFLSSFFWIWRPRAQLVPAAGAMAGEAIPGR